MIKICVWHSVTASPLSSLLPVSDCELSHISSIAAYIGARGSSQLSIAARQIIVRSQPGLSSLHWRLCAERIGFQQIKNDGIGPSKGERICCYFIHCLHYTVSTLPHLPLVEGSAAFEGLIARLSRLQFGCDRICFYYAIPM